MKEYWRDFLLPVTSQPSQIFSVPASLLENHVSEVSAAQEWETEWNSQGLLSRLSPEVGRTSVRRDMLDTFWTKVLIYTSMIVLLCIKVITKDT